MKFLTRDVNKSLLVLVIFFLILFIVFTAYYENSLRNILNRYKKDQEIFGGLTANAVIEESNKTSNLKENVQKYKEYLEKRYDELSIMNENLKNENDNLKAELILIKSSIEYQKAKEIRPTQHFVLYQSKVEEIGKLKKKINELCSEIKALNITRKECD